MHPILSACNLQSTLLPCSRYSKSFSVIEPTMFNVCEYWFNKDQNRLRDIRPDSLAQILNLANVRPGGRYLVVDDASGVVVSAVLDRLGGKHCSPSLPRPFMNVIAFRPRTADHNMRRRLPSCVPRHDADELPQGGYEHHVLSELGNGRRGLHAQYVAVSLFQFNAILTAG